MKLQIKEVLRQLAFPESTVLSPPPRKLPTKRAKKRVNSKSNEALTSRIPSSWRRVDNRGVDIVDS